MTRPHVCGYRFLQVVQVKEVREEKVERTQTQIVSNALAIRSSSSLPFRRGHATTPVLRASDGEIKALGSALIIPPRDVALVGY